MKTLALTVLVHEGPMARSYLGMLAAAGYRVERVILLLQKRDAATGRPLAPWLPPALRRHWSRTVQDLRMNYWPREFLRSHELLCRPWLEALSRLYGFDAAVYRALVDKPDYRKYADTVDAILTDGLDDPVLEMHLKRLPGKRAVLFTGGGMIRNNLFDIPHCRFIHVHPGLLPNVRGADGLLWSMLLRGRPGATAFYMQPGLDVGDIIESAEFEIPCVPSGFAQLDPLMAYRLLYAFVDPMIRAVLLLRIASRGNEDFVSLPALAQRPEEGFTFHFMNTALRRVAFEQLAMASGMLSMSPGQETS